MSKYWEPPSTFKYKHDFILNLIVLPNSTQNTHRLFSYPLYSKFEKFQSSEKYQEYVRPISKISHCVFLSETIPNIHCLSGTLFPWHGARCELLVALRKQWDKPNSQRKKIDREEMLILEGNALWLALKQFFCLILKLHKNNIRKCNYRPYHDRLLYLSLQYSNALFDNETLPFCKKWYRIMTLVQQINACLIALKTIFAVVILDKPFAYETWTISTRTFVLIIAAHFPPLSEKGIRVRK